MKTLLLTLALLFSAPSFADPMAIDVPIVLMTQEEFSQLVTEVKKLYAERDALKSQLTKSEKSCKKT